MARAFGSYPKCRRFKSYCRYQRNGCSLWRVHCDSGPLVKRLRHRPFTAGSRVRIPYESPDEKTHQQKFLLVCFLFYITMLFYLSLNRIEISKHKYKEYSCRYFIAFIKSKNYLQLKFKKLIILYFSHNPN